MNINPYQTLGVGEKATQDEIKKAYKKLAMKYHPDKNPGDKKAEEEFKKVNEAYQMIGSEEARKKYDSGGFDPNQFSQGFNYGGGGFSQGFHFSFEDLENDLFDSLFGFSGRGQKKRGFGFGGSAGGRFRGDDQHFKMNIDVYDAISGGARVVGLPDGRSLEVKIPAGIKSGQKLRMKGQGGRGMNGGSNGDLLIEVDIQEHENIKLVGDDVILELDLPLEIAIPGGIWAINTPTGNFTLNVPEWTDSGKKFRLKGKGVAGRGDLYVITRIKLGEKNPMLKEIFKNNSEQQARA